MQPSVERGPELASHHVLLADAIETYARAVRATARGDTANELSGDLSKSPPRLQAASVSKDAVFAGYLRARPRPSLRRR